MDAALNQLSTTKLSAHAVYEAKLSALAALRRQWLAPQRRLSAVWNEANTAGGASAIANAIADTDAETIRSFAGAISGNGVKRFAWVGNRNQISELREQGFTLQASRSG
jgi:hypothetical protein